MESLLVTFDECRLQIPFVSASSSSSSLNNIHPSTATTTTTLAVGSGGMSVFLELLESKLPQLSDLLCAYIELQEDDISVVQAVVSEKEETNTTDHSQQQRRSLHFLTSYMDILSSCMAIVLSECRLMYRHRGDLPHPPYLADFITLVKLSLDRVIQLSSQTSSAAGRGVGGYGDGYVSDGSEGLDVDEQNHHHRSSSSSFSARVPIYRALYRRINRFAMDMSKIIWMSGDSEAAAATKNNTTSTTLSQQHQGLLSLLEDLKTNPSDITVVVNELVLIDAVEVTPCQCVESGLPDDKTPLRFCHTCRAEFFKQQQQQLMQQLDSGGGAVGGLLVAGTSDKDGPVTTLVPKRVIGQLFSEDGKRKRDILALREWADILTSRNPDIKLPSFVNGMTTTDLQNNNAGNSSSQLDVESIIPNGGGGNGSRRGSRTSKTSGISESGVGLNDSTAADISLNTPVGQSPRDLLSEYNGNDGTDILDSFDLDLLALETAQLISWTYADVKVTFPSPNAV